MQVWIKEPDMRTFEGRLEAVFMHIRGNPEPDYGLAIHHPDYTAEFNVRTGQADIKIRNKEGKIKTAQMSFLENLTFHELLLWVVA